MKENSPLISVIVPVYNAEEKISRCLESLKKQTYSNMEFILIDDGSTDNSAHICKSFCKKDPRFIYAYQKNQGVSSARNHGLKISKGEYIAFCDSDDWVEASMYESLYKIMIEGEADVSINSFIVESEEKPGKFVDDEKLYIFTAREAIKEMCLGKRFAGHLCNKLVQREFLEGLSLNENVAIYEDMLFMWDVFYNAKRIVFQDVHKYHYIQNSNSATHRYKPSMWTVQEACKLIFEKTTEKISELKIYAQKTVICGNMSLATVLYENKKMTKENYRKIKQYIKPNMQKDVLLLIPRGLRRNTKIFAWGYWPYLVYMRLRKNKLARKLFGKV